MVRTRAKNNQNTTKTNRPLNSFCSKQFLIVNEKLLLQDEALMVMHNEFSPELWKQIETEIEQYLTRVDSPHYAAFDADGTLWNTDAGETFFHYQLAHSDFSHLPQDPWNHYLNWKEKDPFGAYLWLAQINEGQRLEKVRQWGKDCLRKNNPWPLFQSQRRLIAWLKAKGVRVFVVTASIKWSVEPFAELMGLHYDDVIGIETEVKQGVVTKHQKGPITWKEGKVEALLDKTQGVHPCLCVGNTMGDAALLEASKAVSLAVCSSQQGEDLYETEMSLQQMARSNQWLSHSFSTK